MNSAAFDPADAHRHRLSDNTARIWDARSGQKIAAVAFDASVSVLAIYGTAVALGDGLGRVHVLDLAADEPHEGRDPWIRSHLATAERRTVDLEACEGAHAFARPSPACASPAGGIKDARSEPAPPVADP